MLLENAQLRSSEANLKSAKFCTSTPNLKNVITDQRTQEPYRLLVLDQFEAMRIEHFKEEIKFLKKKIAKLADQNATLLMENDDLKSTIANASFNSKDSRVLFVVAYFILTNKN